MHHYAGMTYTNAVAPEVVPDTAQYSGTHQIQSAEILSIVKRYGLDTIQQFYAAFKVSKYDGKKLKITEIKGRDHSPLL